MEMENPSIEHFIEKGSAMNSMRKQSTLTDFLLICDDRGEDVNYPVHKVVLASCSKYFHDFFHENPLDKHLRVSEISADTLQTLLEFIYTGYLEIRDGTNVATVLVWASHLRIQMAVRMCTRMILKTISNENVIEFVKIAEEFQIDVMKEGLLIYLQNNFKSVIESDIFERLPVEYIKGVFSKELPNCSCDEIFLAILKWIQGDEDARGQIGCVLLNCIEPDKMSMECILKISENAVVLSDPRLTQKLLKEISKKMRSSTLLGLQDPIPSGKITDEMTSRQNSSLAVVESCNEVAASSESIVVSTNKNSAFSESDEEFKTIYMGTQVNVLNLPVKPNDYEVMKSPKFLCFVHHNEKHALICNDIVEGTKDGFIDPITIWFTDEEMPYQTHAAVCVFGNKIYFMGGVDKINGRKTLKTTIVLDVQTKQWERKADMNCFRERAACAVSANKIYVVGGYFEKWLDTVECYDISSNTWTILPNMLEAVSDPSVCFYQGDLYVVGMYECNIVRRERQCALQRHDLFSRQWSKIDIESFQGNGLRFRMAMISDRIFIVPIPLITSSLSSFLEYYPISDRQFFHNTPSNAIKDIVYLGYYSEYICLVDTDGRLILLSLENMEIMKEYRLKFLGELHNVVCAEF